MENADNWRHSFEYAIPNRTPCVSLCLFVSVSLCLFFMGQRMRSSMPHDIREPSKSRDSPSIVLDRERIPPLDTMPVLYGIPLPEPGTICHIKMTSLAVDHHKRRIPMMHPLIRIEHVDVLLFLRGIYIGPVNPRPSHDSQGA